MIQDTKLDPEKRKQRIMQLVQHGLNGQTAPKKELLNLSDLAVLDVDMKISVIQFILDENSDQCTTKLKSSCVEERSEDANTVQKVFTKGYFRIGEIYKQLKVDLFVDCIECSAKKCNYRSSCTKSKTI